MITTSGADQRADRIAARATGLGVGLIVFMLTWTIGARISELTFDRPTYVYVAMGVALVVGAVTTVWAGQRLSASTRNEHSADRRVDATGASRDT